MKTAIKRLIVFVLFSMFTAHAAEWAYIDVEPQTSGSPVVLSERLCNASTKAGTGWFSKPGVNYDLSSWPTGKRNLNGVVFDRPNNRKKDCIMLSGAGSSTDAKEVRGLSVDRTCDVLYFLHTYHAGPALREWQNWDAETKARGEAPLEWPALFSYIVHYEDRSSVEIKVRWIESINDWLRAGAWADPPYAVTAWRKTVNEGLVMDRWPREGAHLAAYAMRFENPRPHLKVTSIDMVTANDAENDWGAPALLAISTGNREYEGTTYYVAPDGDDANPGTFDQPWGTVYRAADTLTAGDTVYVRGGRYMVKQPWNEYIEVKQSGSKARPITFAGYPGETAIIDGDKHHCAFDTRVPYAIYDRDQGLFNIFEKMNITVRGLWFMHSRKSGLGVYDTRNVILDHNTVYGTSHCGFNTSRNNRFLIVGNTLGQVCSYTFGWNRETQAWEELVSRGPRDRARLLTVQPGREGIDNHGNEYTEIAFNEMYWCNKEGIADPSRHFKIHHNYIHHMPHRSDTFWPCGIYLDAYGEIMDDLEVYRNVIHDAAGGIVLGSEGGTLSRGVHIHHNLSFNNTWNGIEINAAGHNGRRENTLIEYNTIWNCGHTPWEKGPTGGISVHTDNLRDLTIRRNIIVGCRDYNITIRPSIDRVAQNVVITENLYDPVFLPTERIEQRLNVYRPVVSDRFFHGDPMFVDPKNMDFRLKPQSPAVDALAGAWDPDGTPADLGAYAIRNTVPPMPPSGQGLVLRVNCGADEDYTDGQGRTWKAHMRLEKNPGPGEWGSSWGRAVRRDKRRIDRADDPTIYLTEYFSMERYEFNIEPGLYAVRLHFAETYHTEEGARVFDVRINKRPVLTDFDVVREAGGPNAAIVRECEVPVYAKGLLIEFKKKKDNPIINGIEVIQVTE